MSRSLNILYNLTAYKMLSQNPIELILLNKSNDNLVLPFTAHATDYYGKSFVLSPKHKFNIAS